VGWFEEFIITDGIGSASIELLGELLGELLFIPFFYVSKDFLV